MSGIAPNMKQTVNENKAMESELREIQLKQDAGQTIGPETFDPCKQEHDVFKRCVNESKNNSFIDCTDYWNNSKKCENYWREVQDYRVKKLYKTGFEYPKGLEYEQWKSKMHDWYVTGKLTPPENL